MLGSLLISTPPFMLNDVIFDVTSKTGIVYVKDNRALARANSTVHLTVMLGSLRTYNLVVNLYGKGRNQPHCGKEHDVNIRLQADTI